jgi:hypothetical protein
MVVPTVTFFNLLGYLGGCILSLPICRLTFIEFADEFPKIHNFWIENTRFT